MQIVHGLNSLNLNLKGSVITIGNFDGVHLGHQALINQVRARAKEKDLTSIVLTFNQHPAKILSPENTSPRLFSIDDLQSEIQRHGIDVLIIEPFTAEFSEVSATDFVHKILLAQLQAKHIVVGHDFMFGRNREGNIHFLRNIANQIELAVEQVPPVVVDNEVVSSSSIRKLIALGDMEKSKRYLGRSFFLVGSHVDGEGRGQRLGIPTINFKSEGEIVPASGVYITQLATSDNKVFSALTNIGHKPTFHESYELTIESYLLNKEWVDIQKKIKIVFHKRLRAEMKFPSVEKLIEQIDKDIAAGIDYFNTYV